MCKVSELVEQLTDDERKSLEKLGGGRPAEDVPAGHAAKFVELGLTELACGAEVLTRSGRRALGLLR